MCSRRVQFESDKASYLFNWNTRSLQEILQTHCKINTRTIPGLLKKGLGFRCLKRENVREQTHILVELREYFTTQTFQFETCKHRQICLKCPFSFETPCNIGKSEQYRQYTYLTESLGLSYRELYSSSLIKSIPSIRSLENKYTFDVFGIRYLVNKHIQLRISPDLLPDLRGTSRPGLILSRRSKGYHMWSPHTIIILLSCWCFNVRLTGMFTNNFKFSRCIQ